MLVWKSCTVRQSEPAQVPVVLQNRKPVKYLFFLLCYYNIYYYDFLDSKCVIFLLFFAISLLF